MHRLAWLIGAGIAAYLLFLALGAPAQLLHGMLARLPVAAELHGTQGTLWRGQARTLVLAGEPVGRLRWRVRPAGLFRGRLVLEPEIDGDDTMLRARVDAGRQDVVVSGLHAMAPARTITRIAGTQSGAVDARVVMSGVALTVRKGGFTAISGDVRLLDVQLALAERVALGDYRLALRMDGDRIAAALDDRSDLLAVNGDITLDMDGAWELELNVAARGDDAGLRMVLAALSEAGADGSHRIHLRGTLR